MRFLTYLSDRTGEPRPGVWADGNVHGGAAANLIEVLARGREAAHRWGLETLRNPAETVPEDAATLLAPIPVPPSVRDFMSFEAHVVTSMSALGRRVDPEWYAAPVFYFSNPAAACAASTNVEISPGASAFDYEVEIAAVIGLAGRDITVGEASRHVAGYTIFVDWSARDLQEKEMRNGLGPAKGKDSATSLGPYLVTPDELEPLRRGQGYDSAMTASVNGRLYTEGNWSDIHWSFEQMISYASRGTELRPGDVIGSGTVGTGCILELSAVHGVERYPYLMPGDQVVVTVEALGTSSCTMQPALEVHPLWPEPAMQTGQEAAAIRLQKPPAR